MHLDSPSHEPRTVFTDCDHAGRSQQEKITTMNSVFRMADFAKHIISEEGERSISGRHSRSHSNLFGQKQPLDTINGTTGGWRPRDARKHALYCEAALDGYEKRMGRPQGVRRKLSQGTRKHTNGAKKHWPRGERSNLSSPHQAIPVCSSPTLVKAAYRRQPLTTPPCEAHFVPLLCPHRLGVTQTRIRAYNWRQ